MAFTDAGAVAASIWDDVGCPEWAESLPIEVEAAQEAKVDEPCGVSCARIREELEATMAKIEAEGRMLTEAMAVLVTGLAGGDTYARAVVLVQLIAAGDRPVSELVELFQCGFRRVQAARILQVAVRSWRWRRIALESEPFCQAGSLLVSAYRWTVPDLRLLRLGHGASRAWEVHAAVRGVERPLCTWLASTSTARRYLWHVPEVDYMRLAIMLRRGVGAVTARGICLAREHAARRIQWWFQLWQLRRLLIRHAAGQAQLEAWQEARKARRRAARARARAGGIGAGSSAGRIEASPEATARAAAAVGEGCAAPGQAGVRRRLEGRYRWAGAAFFVAAALWGLAIRPALVLSPAAFHHLPRPPGARFGGSGGGPSAVDLRLRWLWMQASPAAVLAVVQGAARGGSGRGGQAVVGDSLGYLDGRTLDGQSVWLVSQPVALREALRLRDGPWGLPRPPEWRLVEYGWRQARVTLADAGYVDCSGSVVARLLTGGVDRGGAVGAGQACEPVAGSRCVALQLVEGALGPHPPGCGACRVCFGVRVLRSGHSVVSSTTGSLGDACQWRRGCRSSGS